VALACRRTKRLEIFESDRLRAEAEKPKQDSFRDDWERSKANLAKWQGNANGGISFSALSCQVPTSWRRISSQFLRILS
jgi:hypothetical protein